MRCPEKAKIAQGVSRIRSRILRLRHMRGVHPQQVVTLRPFNIEQ
jgi:hypothetical protein